MTDKELMQQALEALELHAKHYPHMVKGYTADAATALRERLAQWDALDRMAANARKLGLNYEPVHSTQISKIWWDLHGDKLMAERIDPATIYQKPQIQPCAGRNCGSTNPNLHSAECFEDYDKATGMNQWQGLTDEEIIDVLHPLVMDDMSDEATDYEIARAIEAKLKERNA